MSVVTPNAAQRDAVSAYSAEPVSWEVKRGEYDNEAAPMGGFAMVATLANGWRVTVGRYGGVLAEERGAEPQCAACDGTGTVVEVEPVGDGTVSHTFPCVCPRGRELDAARWEEDEVDRLVRESEPDSVELAEQREAVAMRDWRCSCDRGEGRIDRECEVHGAGVEA